MVVSARQAIEGFRIANMENLVSFGFSLLKKERNVNFPFI